MKNWKIMRAHDRGEAIEMCNREHGKWMEIRKGSPPKWNFKMYKYRLVRPVKEVDWSKVKRFDEILNIGGSEDMSKSYFISIKGDIVNYIEINNSTTYYSLHRQYTKYLKLK